MNWNSSSDVLAWMTARMPATTAGMWPQQREQVALRVWNMFKAGSVNDVLDAVDAVVDSLAEIQPH
jgi:hypothetical protein